MGQGSKRTSEARREGFASAQKDNAGGTVTITQNRKHNTMKSKGNWKADLRPMLAKLPDTFTTANAYQFEARLAKLHPENQNVRPKIRQLLQQLRDDGDLTQAKPGEWTKTDLFKRSMP